MGFYEMIGVELELRQKAKEMPRVFFLVLFACGRDSYVRSTVKGESGFDFDDQGEKIQGKKQARGQNSEISKVQIANFTFVFGSNPATGAAADPDFVTMFLKHLNQVFDPEDGSLMMPECLGNIDSLNNRVNFESTSSNVGKSLLLKRQDVRVGAKQIIVITKNQNFNDEWKEGYREPRTEDNRHERTRLLKRIGQTITIGGKQSDTASEQTKEVIDFFVNDLSFDRNAILYFTEDEVRALIKLFDQSQIFKVYTSLLSDDIRKQAKRVFLEPRKSNCQ